MKKTITSILFVLIHLSVFAQVPTNNDCANAINLTDLNNYCAEQLFGEPTFDIIDGTCPPTFNPALNIWYRFTALGATVTISAAGGSTLYKITLVRFPFGPCGITEILDCNASVLTNSNLTIGDEYYIIISSGNISENFELCINNPVPVPPPNNEPCFAITLENDITLCGTTLDATATIPAAGLSCPTVSSNQVWYQVNIPADQTNLEITLQASTLSGGVQLIAGQWTSGCTGTFQFLEAHVYCGPAINTFEFNCMTPGNYYILLSSSNTGAGEFCITASTFGSPPECRINDNCAEADVITGLVLNGEPTCVSGCNLGACGESFNFSGCNYASSVVWYSLVTPLGARRLNITINSSDGSLSNPQVQFFGSNCGTLTPVSGCFIGANGGLNVLSLEVNSGNTYLMAVGNHSGTAGNFEICVSASDPETACVFEAAMVPTHTSLGSPLSGPYQSGEDVTFSYTFTFSSMNNSCQWPHGVVPVFGPCWDLTKSDLEDTGFGNWKWFREGMVTYKTENPFILSSTGADAMQKLCYHLDPNCSGEPLTTGMGLPAGWFYTNGGGPCANQSDPNNSWGENCNGCESTCLLNFQFTLRSKSFVDCEGSSSADCGVQVFVFSDRQTGCWNGGGDNTCIDDIPAYFNSSLNCCKGPVVDAAEADICSGTAFNIELKSDEDDFGVTYEWNVMSSGGIIGASSGTGSLISQNLVNTTSNVRSVIYAVRGRNSTGCFGEISYVKVFVRPEINVTFLTNPENGCTDESFDISASSVGGFGAPYSYVWSYQQSSDSSITGITPGMEGDFPISVTVTDVAGCTSVGSTMVKVGPVEDITFQMEKPVYCYNEGPIALKASPPGGDWVSLDPEISIENNIINSWQLSAESNYKFIYSTISNDCYFSDTLIIEVVFSARDCPDKSVEIYSEGLESPFTGIISTLPIFSNLTENIEVRIFDTLGKELYYSKNYQNDWNADKYPAGLYFFIVTSDGKTFQKVVSVIK